MKHFVAILILGAGLSACSFYLVQHDSEVLSMEKQGSTTSSLEGMIEPYRSELAEQMDEVIGYNPEFMSKSRPCSPIHNWVADAVMSESLRTVRMQAPVMVLLNHGGIRSALPQGPITVGNVYELMPFDNRLVWLKMEISYLDTLSKYLNASGGEPISGVEMMDGELDFHANFHGDHFWVLTSDYLANGGDQMSFFSAALERNETSKLLRNLFIDAVKSQDTLHIDSTCRIQLKP